MSIADAVRTRELEARLAALEERMAALEQGDGNGSSTQAHRLMQGQLNSLRLRVAALEPVKSNDAA